MSVISSELITKLGAAMHQIWQTVSVTSTDATGIPLSFSDSLTVPAPLSDLYSEMAVPKLIIQFAFANLPENSHVVLLGQETVADLLYSLTSEKATNIDDSAISELRPLVESIVQGICLACGTLKGEAIVASGLTVRFQICSFPQNIQKCHEIVRTNIRISNEDLNGSIVWLMDSETAHNIVSLPMSLDDGDSDQFGRSFGSASVGFSGQARGADVEESGLDILMDIPLEISVELGRVKMAVKDVIDLGSGSIVEIDKAAGEPVDVMVNGRLVARGEVVVIDDNFGVRITEILSPADRVAKLSEVA